MPSNDSALSFASELISQLPSNILWLACIVFSLSGLTAISLSIDSISKKKKLKQALSPISLSTTDSQIYERLKSQLGSTTAKTILFAGSAITAIPVNIVVKMAIENAQRSKKTLLIDLDMMRKPIENIFEIETSQMILSPTGNTKESFVPDLSIYPASCLSLLSHMNIKQIAEQSREKFDNIFIYCPAIETSPDRKQIISASEAGLIFSNNQEQFERMVKLFDKEQILASYINTDPLPKSA